MHLELVRWNIWSLVRKVDITQNGISSDSLRCFGILDAQRDFYLLANYLTFGKIVSDHTHIRVKRLILWIQAWISKLPCLPVHCADICLGAGSVAMSLMSLSSFPTLESWVSGAHRPQWSNKSLLMQRFLPSVPSQSTIETGGSFWYWFLWE